ncbi:hypothetical protein [Ochrobactrum sp. MYb379]|uniref:hypothetical protein n=1 Tax=Ochrobactrum sp. MYb379 TaxID=2745275 RepID=UPI0030B1CEC7
MSGDLSRQVRKAAIWLATTPQLSKPRPVIPHLRQAYGLTAQQAVEAITESNLIKARSQ